MEPGKVWLIPSLLADEAIDSIPPQILDAVRQCQVFFVENKRTARRYLKKVWKEMVIDEYEWHDMKTDKESQGIFTQRLKEGKQIGLISEAGCPGIADPGQAYVGIAQKMGIPIKPLTGPNSIVLALMASGLNGQCFQFHGYLPIDNMERIRTIKELESASARNNCTQVFIETPYRNNQLIEAILKSCKPGSRLCIAVDLSSAEEWVKTKTVGEWAKTRVDIHKRPAIFLVYAGEDPGT